MVLAVLEARCGLGFGDRDVYLNVAGGLRISEPAADLAAAAALASSALDMALPQDCVVFGEISLSGDVRPVSRMETPPEGSRQAGLRAARSAPARATPTAASGVAVTGVVAPGRRGAPGSASSRWDMRPRMTLFDIIAGLILVVSALVGLARGATREVTTVIAFVVGRGRRRVRACASPARSRGTCIHDAVAGQRRGRCWWCSSSPIIVLRMIGGMLTRGVQQTALSGARPHPRRLASAWSGAWWSLGGCHPADRRGHAAGPACRAGSPAPSSIRWPAPSAPACCRRSRRKAWTWPGGRAGRRAARSWTAPATTPADDDRRPRRTTPAWL